MAHFRAANRLTKEIKRVKEDPPECVVGIYIDDKNMKEVFFLVEGPEGTPFHGGEYVFKLDLPEEYPMKPPKLSCLTDSGRFETGVHICATFTHYHPESWAPSYTLSTLMKSTVSFMCDTDSGFHIGHYKSRYATKAEAEKVQKKFAKESTAFNKRKNFDQQFPCITDPSLRLKQVANGAGKAGATPANGAEPSKAAGAEEAGVKVAAGAEGAGVNGAGAKVVGVAGVAEGAGAKVAGAKAAEAAAAAAAGAAAARVGMGRAATAEAATARPTVPAAAAAAAKLPAKSAVITVEISDDEDGVGDVAGGGEGVKGAKGRRAVKSGDGKRKRDEAPSAPRRMRQRAQQQQQQQPPAVIVMDD